ncbi:hypothetical protein NOGI109294_18720 [Nocardiopsis gilva]
MVCHGQKCRRRRIRAFSWCLLRYPGLSEYVCSVFGGGQRVMPSVFREAWSSLDGLIYFLFSVVPAAVSELKAARKASALV